MSETRTRTSSTLGSGVFCGLPAGAPTVSFTGEVSNRDYEVSPIDEDASRLSLAASRQIGSDFIATAGGDFDRRKRQDGVDSDIYTIGFSLSRQIARKTSVSSEPLHRNRSSSDRALNTPKTESVFRHIEFSIVIMYEDFYSFPASHFS